MIIIDASIYIAGRLKDETSDLAIKCFKKIGDGELEAIAPEIFPLEVSNALLMSYKRERLDKKNLIKLIHLFSEFPVEIDTYGAVGARIWAAIEHDLTVYDAAYLELAQRRCIPLATLDKKLHKAAKSMGVACC